MSPSQRPVDPPRRGPSQMNIQFIELTTGDEVPQSGAAVFTDELWLQWIYHYGGKWLNIGVSYGETRAGFSIIIIINLL